MSGDAFKAYWYLLCESWLQVPRATLPMDDSEIASLARVEYHKWNAKQTQSGRKVSIKDEVMAMFKEGVCDEHKGRYYNERLLEESRKSEAKKRPGNKNAKGTQNKRKEDTALKLQMQLQLKMLLLLRLLLNLPIRMGLII